MLTSKQKAREVKWAHKNLTQYPETCLDFWEKHFSAPWLKIKCKFRFQQWRVILSNFQKKASLLVLKRGLKDETVAYHLRKGSLKKITYKKNIKIHYFLLPISKGRIVLWSNFRSKYFHGLTRFKVPWIQKSHFQRLVCVSVCVCECVLKINLRLVLLL